MNKERLDHCPFCGNRNIVITKEMTAPTWKDVVYCSVCDIAIPKEIWQKREGEKQYATVVVESVKNKIKADLDWFDEGVWLDRHTIHQCIDGTLKKCDRDLMDDPWY